jgi:hypothetical protein
LLGELAMKQDAAGMGPDRFSKFAEFCKLVRWNTLLLSGGRNCD